MSKSAKASAMLKQEIDKARSLNLPAPAGDWLDGDSSLSPKEVRDQFVALQISRQTNANNVAMEVGYYGASLNSSWRSAQADADPYTKNLNLVKALTQAVERSEIGQSDAVLYFLGCLK